MGPPPSAEQSKASGSAHSLPKTKLAAVTRFKNMAGGSGKKEPNIVFPPPSWFITDSKPPTLNDSETSLKQDTSKDGLGDGGAEIEAPEPTTFAMKIRQLIDSLPLPASVSAVVGSGHAAGTAPAASSSSAPQRTSSESLARPIDDKGPPIPDFLDARTMRLLSSENVMNGDDPRVPGAQRQSIWSELERMNPREHEKGEGRGAGHRHGHGDVMMYAPLEPTPDSEVELAESELEYADEPPPAAGDAVSQDRGKGKAAANDTGAPQTESTARPSSFVTHWVPSTTKISVLTTWWGYRLYLPPPVMATLDSNQLKATQRAAMITTALQWFLRRVPTIMLPPPIKPAVVLLRRLAPILSYIGVFIAWSWTRISASDKGNGVVLTATWLLPVALIPMAWDAGDIHGPRNRPPTPKEEAPPEDAAGAAQGGKSAEQREKKKG
ncbi:hypothetical protein DXG03_003534 [Asterophora parasitica]|uniref:Uncharacterized protein n=1 Tax=Asterophora parasitica TaxID=117018 RepID=A0A9P7G218_9AGAR|nr:hypothetical protein DXG03_003534 [Asterophora parasitica]